MIVSSVPRTPSVQRLRKPIPPKNLCPKIMLWEYLLWILVCSSTPVGIPIVANAVGIYLGYRLRADSSLKEWSTFCGESKLGSNLFLCWLKPGYLQLHSLSIVSFKALVFCWYPASLPNFCRQCKRRLDQFWLFNL